ncbi:hypothetical protein J3F84DRAFT_67848 [Trichoderma pleuroticola]
MSSRGGQPQKMMGFVTQRVGSTVSTLCGIAWFAIPGTAAAAGHMDCVRSAMSSPSRARLILSVMSCHVRAQHKDGRRPPTYTEPCTSLLCFEPRASCQLETSTCGATRGVPCHAQGAGPLWPASRLQPPCPDAARSRPRPQAGPPIGGCGISAHLVGAAMIRQRLVIL